MPMIGYLEPLLYAAAAAGVALVVVLVVLACVWNTEPARRPKGRYCYCAPRGVCPHQPPCRPRRYRRP